VPLFNNSVIFVEYPINVFDSYTCDPLALHLMYYDDANNAVPLVSFSSQSFGTRSYDQTCYFILHKALPYIPPQLLKIDKSVFSLDRLEFRTRIFVKLTGLIPGALIYRQRESNIAISKSGAAYNLVKTPKCGPESLLVDQYETSFYQDFDTYWFHTKDSMTANYLGYTQRNGFCTTARGFVNPDTVDI